MVTTVYPVRWVNWAAITLAAAICSAELAEGGRARISGFSASPSCTGENGAGTVSVGVTAGVGEGGGVGCGMFKLGNVQFASKIMPASKRIVKKVSVRFTPNSQRL